MIMRMKCPTCGPNSKDKFYTKRSGHILQRCSICGLVYLMNNEEFINDDFFEDAGKTVLDQNKNEKSQDAIEYWSYPHFYERYQAVFHSFFEDRWQKIIRAKSSIESLLDIGCGYGFFMEFVQKYVPVVEGLDLNSEVVRYAVEEKGLPVTECPVEDYDPQKRYDAIVMCDVLEHVKEPLVVLESCRELLTEEGVLFVQVPNLTGFRVPMDHSWGLPHHVWQFSPGSLRKMLLKSGFQVSAWHTGVLGVIGSYERGGPFWWEKLMWGAARYFKLGNRLQMVGIKR